MAEKGTYEKLEKILSYNYDRKSMTIEAILNLMFDWFSGDDMKGFYEHVKKEYDKDEEDSDSTD